jgi:hypothetical protein
MDGSQRAYARRVQVRYETRRYGLALTIVDDLDHPDGLDHESGGVPWALAYGAGDLNPGPDLDGGDGVLTVGDTGVTTLELRRGDGSPSILVWDAAEVDWDSLRAG